MATVTSPTLLLIADNSALEALGSKLVRGAKAIDLGESRDLQITYNSPAAQFSPSMQRLRGKLFYRLADRRSWEWWGFQRKLTERIRTMQPRLVLVTGILPFQTSIFNAIKEGGGQITNYLTDDPWNPIHRRRSFLRNLRHYDHIFSTKQALCERLEKAGTPSTSWLPFAYDPALQHPPFTTQSCTQREQHQSQSPLKALWTGVDNVDADAETATRVQEDQQSATLKESA